MRRLPYAPTTAGRVVGGLRQMREFTKRGRFGPEGRAAVEEILASIPPIDGLPPPRTWTISRFLSTTEDSGVMSLSPRFSGGAAVAVLKLSRGPQAANSMRRETGVLRQLTDDARLEELRRLLPEVLACGETRGRSYLLMKAL